MTTFADLGLSQPVLQALDMKGYTIPTPIQEQAIPAVLKGRDLLGIAQTGTGKTAAFMLPSIDRLREADKQIPFKSCRMLVLAPTRELAVQIADSAKDYGALAGLKVQCIVGGTSVGKDRNKLHRGTDILVATPGRLLDLIDQKALNLAGIEVLVLDEADQMLDLGFIHALRRIAGLLPKARQTMLFSATMPKQMEEIAAAFLTDPVRVQVNPPGKAVDRIEQSIHFVARAAKTELLIELLDAHRDGLALVFARTKHGADKLARQLEHAGFATAAIHGNRSQGQRDRALADFRQGRVRVLVATDVAARGIDILGVTHVYNYDLPNVPENYVHRIGRTARAGATGIAVALCSPDEMGELKDIQKAMKATIPIASGAPWEPMPGARPEPRPQPGRRPQGATAKPGAAGAPANATAKPSGQRRRPRRPRAA
jgi:ATP-dependent RNA helicase RhlE